MKRLALIAIVVAALGACNKQDPNDTDQCKVWQANWAIAQDLTPTMQAIHLKNRPDGCDIP